MSDKTELLKLLYEKCYEKHQYYLTWRQYLLAGFFTVHAAFYYAIYELICDGMGQYLPILGIAMTVVSSIFALLDERNRKLSNAAFDAAAKAEEVAIAGTGIQSYGIGLFKGLRKAGGLTHTWILRMLFTAGMIMGVLIAFKFVDQV
jgi:hypothetical protein